MGKQYTRPSWNYKMGNNITEQMEKDKELGVIIQNNLFPEKHKQNYKLLLSEQHFTIWMKI